MKKEKTPEQKIAELRQTIINCLPDHSPAWKDATIEQLDQLLKLVEGRGRWVPYEHIPAGQGPNPSS
jgi:hypothetical protein